MPPNEVKVVFGHIDQLSGGLTKILTQLGSLVGLAATVGVSIQGMTRAIELAGEREKVLRQVDAVLRSTAGSAGMSAVELRKHAQALEDITAVDAEVISRGQAVLLTFTQIGRSVFPEATEAALNMSVALGTDLQSSIIQLGKALNDPIKGVTALREVGVSFTEEQQNTIKALVGTGHLLDAQKLILKELQVEFGGAATAVGDTYAGSLDKAKNAMKDAQTAMGEALLPTVARIAEKVRDAAEGFKEFWEKVTGNEAERAVRLLKEFGASVEDIARAEAFAKLIRNAEKLEDAKGGVAGALKSIADDVDYIGNAMARGQARINDYATAFGTGQAEAAHNAQMMNRAMQEQLDLVAKATVNHQELDQTLQGLGVNYQGLVDSMRSISEVKEPLDVKNLETVTRLSRELQLAVSDVIAAYEIHGTIGEKEYKTLSSLLLDYLQDVERYEKMLQTVKQLEEDRARLAEQQKTGDDGTQGKGGATPPPPGPGVDPEAQAKAIKALQEMADDYRLSEVEKIQKWYDETLKLLGENEDAKLLLQEVYAERLNELNDKQLKTEMEKQEKAAKDRKALKDKEMKEEEARRRQEQQFYLNMLQNIQVAANAAGKHGFVIAKAAAIGEATMNTYQAATKALAQGGIFGFIGMATVIAAGLAQVAKIMAQQPPQAHGGLENVPEDATYMLRAGERVLAPAQNRALMDTLERIGAALDTVPGATHGGGFPGTGGPHGDTPGSGGGIGAINPFSQVNQSLWMDTAQLQGLATQLRADPSGMESVMLKIMQGPGSDWEKHSKWDELIDLMAKQYWTENPLAEGAGLTPGQALGKKFARERAEALAAANAQPAADWVQQFTGGAASGPVRDTGPINVGNIYIAPTNTQSLKDMTAEDWRQVINAGLAPALEAAFRSGMLRLPSGSFSME